MGSWVGRLGSRAYVVASHCGGGELFEMRQQRRDWFLYLVRIVNKKTSYRERLTMDEASVLSGPLPPIFAVYVYFHSSKEPT